eukprot:766830-Hanusia_phi.AAC.1
MERPGTGKRGMHGGGERSRRKNRGSRNRSRWKNRGSRVSRRGREDLGRREWQGKGEKCIRHEVKKGNVYDKAIATLDSLSGGNFQSPGVLRPLAGPPLAPSAAFGMQAGLMGPPGTIMRPPTGARLGTSMRMGTAMRPGSRAGLGPLNTNIQVAERPLTQQGMMGMKVTVQGPGRQIADKTYYMGELRKKCDEMQSEIRKMNVEVEQYNKDNQIYNQMERKYEVLIKDVRKLQGDLADLNLIVDKSRNNTDPQDIASAFQALKGKNDADRRRLDRLFLDCQEKENDIRTIEQQCAELQRKVEEKLNALPQDQRMQHAQLQDDYKRLLADVEQKQLTYDNLCRQLSAGEEVLLAEPLKQRLNSIQEQKLKLLQEKQNLEAELSKPVMSEDEEREMLLSQVKEDNNQIKITERNMEEIQSKTRQVSQDLEQLEKDGGIKESEDAKKYQRLREKDQEMTEFIENFDQNHSKESSTVKEIETRIFKLLEHISKDLQRQQQLPSKENFQDLQDEVAVKQRGLENSQSTAERLKQEKKNRDAELEKIVNLDQKINVELTSLREKSEQMKQELEVFNDINKLKKVCVFLPPLLSLLLPRPVTYPHKLQQDAESNRLAMTAKKAQLDSRRKALKQQVALAVLLLAHAVLLLVPLPLRHPFPLGEERRGKERMMKERRGDDDVDEATRLATHPFLRIAGGCRAEAAALRAEYFSSPRV